MTEHEHSERCGCEFHPEKVVAKVAGRDWSARIYAGESHLRADVYGVDLAVWDLRRANEAIGIQTWPFLSVDDAVAAVERRARQKRDTR
jgi:hypothetical protein